MAYLERRECEYDGKTLVNFYKEGESEQPFVAGVIVFTSTPDKIRNKYYLGPAPLEHMATQIATAFGPCGNNRDYLFLLEKAMFDIGHEDEYVIELANEVRKILGGSFGQKVSASNNRIIQKSSAKIDDRKSVQETDPLPKLPKNPEVSRRPRYDYSGYFQSFGKVLERSVLRLVLFFFRLLLRIFHHASAGKQNWCHWCDCHGCDCHEMNTLFNQVLSPIHVLVYCLSKGGRKESYRLFANCIERIQPKVWDHDPDLASFQALPEFKELQEEVCFPNMSAKFLLFLIKHRI